MHSTAKRHVIRCTTAMVQWMRVLELVRVSGSVTKSTSNTRCTTFSLHLIPIVAQADQYLGCELPFSILICVRGDSTGIVAMRIFCSCRDCRASCFPSCDMQGYLLYNRQTKIIRWPGVPPSFIPTKALQRPLWQANAARV